MVSIAQNSNLTRSNIWVTDRIKQLFDDPLMSDLAVEWIRFTDGTTLNIPAVGDFTTNDYVEGAEITVSPATDSNFTLTIDKYKQAGFSVTEKFKQDSVYQAMAIAMFEKKLAQAILRQKESDVHHLQASQTASNPNTVDGVDHRVISLATSELGRPADFQLALLAMMVSNVPGPYVGFISPFLTYELQSLASSGNFFWDRQYYGDNTMLRDGKNSGGATASLGRIFGIDLFSSNVLDYAVAETITNTGKAAGAGARSVTSADANLVLGKEAIIGAMRHEPDTLIFDDNKSRSTIVHSTIRYGLKLYRPESMFTLLTDRS